MDYITYKHDDKYFKILDIGNKKRVYYTFKRLHKDMSNLLNFIKIDYNKNTRTSKRILKMIDNFKKYDKCLLMENKRTDSLGQYLVIDNIITLRIRNFNGEKITYIPYKQILKAFLHEVAHLCQDYPQFKKEINENKNIDFKTYDVKFYMEEDSDDEEESDEEYKKRHKRHHNKDFQLNHKILKDNSIVVFKRLYRWEVYMRYPYIDPQWAIPGFL